MISFPLCPVKTKSLSPTRAGEASPSPTLTFHFCVSSLGHSFGSVKPVTWLSRLGPRHWSQSSASAGSGNRSTQHPKNPYEARGSHDLSSEGRPISWGPDAPRTSNPEPGGK